MKDEVHEIQYHDTELERKIANKQKMWFPFRLIILILETIIFLASGESLDKKQQDPDPMVTQWYGSAPRIKT